MQHTTNNHSIATDFLESDVIKKMAPAKRAILEQLILKGNSLSLQDALPLLLAAQASLRQQNLSFTPEEMSEITRFFTSRMSPDDQKKYEFLKRFGS